MKLAMCVAAAGAGALAAGSAFADISYSHDFQSGVAGPEWSHQMVETAPLGGQRFLGQFGNEVVTLTLPGVNTGDTVNLAFDFLAIRTWDGNGTHGPGPDIFTVAVGGGPVPLASTFSVGDPTSTACRTRPDRHGSRPAARGDRQRHAGVYLWAQQLPAGRDVAAVVHVHRADGRACDLVRGVANEVERRELGN